jgi:hypothetical protein
MFEDTLKKEISLEIFIETYKDSLGLDGSTKLLTETTIKLGFENQHHFNDEEAALICNELKSHSGFIGIVAGILLTKIGQT